MKCLLDKFSSVQTNFELYIVTLNIVPGQIWPKQGLTMALVWSQEYDTKWACSIHNVYNQLNLENLVSL